MLSILLAISLFSSSDTIVVKGTQGMFYRLFANDSNLYFQYKADKNWSASKIIDEKVSEYAMTVTSGEYIHLAFIKQGTVFYKMNMYSVNKDSLRKENTPRWECNIAVSPSFCEPASNLEFFIDGEYFNFIWHAQSEYKSLNEEIWQRKGQIRYKELPEWREPRNITPFSN
jgi:hypothetical protein